MKKNLQFLFLPILLTGVIYYFSFNFSGKEELTLNDFVEWKIEQKKNKKPENGHPDKAMQWYIEQRAYPLGYIPVDWKEKAVDHIAKNNIKLSKIAAALSWTQLGPGNVGGRIRAIAVHPTDFNVVYIGSVSGGVWKSTNGGQSWRVLKDDMENLAVCSIVIDPDNPNIIYAGTGEGFFNSDAIRGEGIFKSTNAGETWQRLSSTVNSNYYYVNKLVYDNSTNVLWAGTRKGLFKSTNGGSTFLTVLTGNNNADIHCSDIEIAYTNPTTIYASFGLFNKAEIYRSTDAGNSFVFNFSQDGKGRIELATSQSNPGKVYASFMDLNTNGISLFAYTTNGGAEWFQGTVPGPSYSGANNYAGTQGWYNNIIAVDPDNENTLFMGGIDLWKSTDGGVNWSQRTNWYEQSGAPQYIHADQHAIIYSPSNPLIMYIGNDGGVYKSSDRGSTWSARNNDLHITQFYYGAVAPTGTRYYGGTQDNGTILSTGSATWNTIMGGDGGATEIDFTNPQNIYMEYVNFAFFKSTNGGASFAKSMTGIPIGTDYWSGTTDRTLFISPFSMDPNNSNNLVAGTYRVWRTTNGAASWNSISGDLTGDGTGTSGARISTVIVAKGNSNVIYAGCTNGRVQVTTDGGTSWNLRAAGLPNSYCTRITTDPANPSVAYATFSGFSAGNKVYKTTNYGQSWTNISSNLPNIPVNCIVVNPDNTDFLIIGTDLGVFTSANGGAVWTQDNAGLANVSVHDLDYRASDKKLFAATHGRSMYAATLSGSGGGEVTVELSYDDGAPSGGYYWPASGSGSANRITPTIPGAKVVSMSIYFTGVNAGIAKYKPIILNNSSATPGTDYVNIPDRIAVTIPGWDEIDLLPYNITVSNDFYVGLLYDGVNRPSYGYDAVNNGRAWDKSGGNWATYNETYFMRAKIRSTTTDVEVDTKIPENFELSQNYPNPFNPFTKIRYALPEGRDVSIIVYDINGKKVAELVNNFQGAGTYEVTWNGNNDAGIQVASGAYIYTVKAGNFIQTKKMVFLK